MNKIRYMKPELNIPNELKYMKEHLVCENYISDERSILESIEIKAGRHLIREELERSTLGFILSGEMDISTGGAICQRVGERQLFLIPAGDSFHGKAVTNTALIRCSFTRDMALCNRFSIEQWQKHIPTLCQREKCGITLLPIHELLFKELEITRDVMQTGMSCIHFQRIKKEIIFIELRAFYRKEELADLFAPVLGEDNDFKDKVMQIYPRVKTAEELIDRMNMSPTVFKRKFREAFGISARQWLIQKKKEKLFRDILMTNMSISELAEKYKFTTNYITTFCRKHFGKSPKELRMEYKE